MTKALKQLTTRLEKKIDSLERQNRELQWKAKKLAVLCRKTKEANTHNVVSKKI